MKLLVTTMLSLLISASYGQYTEVKFKEESFANGMVYPQVIIPGKPVHSDSINSDLNRKIADLEASEFCIGQYGYVQKSTHLQIHIFCSCIDFEESENRFFLYNVEEGTAVQYSDLFDPKKTKDAGSFLAEQMKGYFNSKQIEFTEELEQTIQKKNLDAFKTEMTKAGLNIWMENIEGWGKEPFQLTWESLKSYLKYHFI